jgi:hypothetical protein
MLSHRNNVPPTWAICWVLIVVAQSCFSALPEAATPSKREMLKSAGDGFVWEPPSRQIRLHFVGDASSGYDVMFELPTGGGWAAGAAFPKGQVWSVYSDWRDSWYAEPHHAKARNIEALPNGRVRVSAEANVGGQQWWFSDVYSLEYGMLRIDRSFGHPGTGSQSRITLESRIRLALGVEQRMLIPAVLYNNNPSSTLIGTRISTDPGGIGLYEEHRLPIPLVNIESAVDGRRLYGSLVTKPSNILQGHKGKDHWWSMGLEYGEEYVDLLSVSGPLATNGKKSQIYGHRHGFDSYDDAYLDVQGPVVFEKTFYLDLGFGIKTGYAFRATLWKAYDLFRPTETPHLPFAEALALVAEHAKNRLYYRPPVWTNDRAAAVVRFGKVQIVEGDALVILRPDGKRDTYRFYATGKQNPFTAAPTAEGRVVGIEIVEPDAWFTKTVDRLIASINANGDSPVVAESPKFLAFSGESWGMRLLAKAPGPEGRNIGLAEEGGKLEFTSNLAGPWGLMGAEPRTPHLVLANAATSPPRAFGYTQWPGGQSFQYAWCGGNLGIAYGMLAYGERMQDAVARQQAIATVQFFVRHAEARTPGLYYGDYDARGNRWLPGGFDGAPAGISSRQFGENLEHLASLVELGRRLRLPEADEWFTALRKAGDFLLRAPEYQGLFPRAWTPEGAALGWPKESAPPPGTISGAGVQCVCALARLATLTGDAKYCEKAATVMDSYWRVFGETLTTPPWGATLDAGAEDKEAGSGMMRAALETYLATQEPRFLIMAQDAADWTLTWMFFHEVPLKPESGLLHEYLHTVGWTFISTQNQEIDVWGYFMAPDYYRLGLASKDERYTQIGRILFQAASQTISRPGAMFGDVPGIQGEHYNHSNCTYVGGQPGTWRGSQHSVGISWTTAGALYGGARLTELAPELFWLGPGAPQKRP